MNITELLNKDTSAPDPLTERVVCTNCLFIGQPIEQSDISKLDILITILFFPFGLIYYLWASSKKKQHCAKCKSVLLVPEDSPRGKALSRQLIIKGDN